MRHLPHPTRRVSTALSTALSRRRRSRLAGPVLLIAGLMLTGGLYSLFSPATAAPEGATSQIAAGRDLFQVSCSSCHGQNGQGILTQRGGQFGPSLVGVGAAAVDFQVGTGRMPMAQPGAQAVRKKVLFTPTETSQLAAYVASLGPGPSVPQASEYDPTGADVVRGGEIFRTNCTACHNFAGSGGALPNGKFAPKLTGVPPKYLFEAMETGPQQMPVFDNQVLKPQDKRDIIAYLKKNEATPGYGGFSMGALGPVSEGMFAWLGGIGILVGFAVWIAAHTARSTKGHLAAEAAGAGPDGTDSKGADL